MHWKPALITLLIFGLGAVAGGLVATTVVHRRVEQVRMQTLPANVTADREFPRRIGVFIEKEMKLSADQRSGVKTMIENYARDQESLRQDLRRRSSALFTDFEKRLNKILTDEQQKNYRSLSRRRQQFLQQFRKPRPSEKPAAMTAEPPAPEAPTPPASQ